MMKLSMSKLIGSYSKREMWFLFLICSLPLHLWTLLLSFRDISWVAQRTNIWDAIGVISYGLIFAFVESVVVFGGCVLLGFLISGSLGGLMRGTLLGTLVLILAGLAMVSQSYFLWGSGARDQIVGYAVNLAHPLRFLYGTELVFVLFVVVLPAFLILKSERILTLVRSILDRLTVLAVAYLLLDLVALLVVVVRNI